MKINIKKLEDIAKVIAGQSPISLYYNDKGEGYPFLQGKTDFGELYPKARTWCTKPKKIAENKDILLSVRAPVGSVNIANMDVCIGRGICAIRVNNKCNFKYLYYYLKTHERQIQRYQTGSTFKSITISKIKQLKISLPKTLNEQKKIANLLTQVESLISKRKESIELLDELLRSSFLDMFGDPALNRKGWEIKAIKEFGKILTGNTPPRKESKYYNSKHIEWIKTNNIHADKIFLSTSKEYLSQDGLTKGRFVNKGSLLVTCIAGSIKSIGNASLTNRKVSFNQQINAIEPNENINSFFLYWLFKLSKSYIQNQAGKGMKKMITKSSFEKITFPYPPKPLQDKFATIVKQVEETKEKYQKSLDELNDLFGSLSQRAFRGELDLSKLEIDKPKIKAIKINGKEVGLSKNRANRVTVGDILSKEVALNTITSAFSPPAISSSLKILKWNNMAHLSKPYMPFKGLEVASNKLNAITSTLTTPFMGSSLALNGVEALTNTWKIEQKKFHQLSGLGKYNENILNFTKEYESLFDSHLTASHTLGQSLLQAQETIKPYKSFLDNNPINSLALDGLQKVIEVNQPYNIALEQLKSMDALRSWGEPHEALINRYMEKIEETTEVIESILNLSDLIDDELFDDILLTDSYDDIKSFVFKLIGEGKLKQEFDGGKMILAKVET